MFDRLCELRSKPTPLSSPAATTPAQAAATAALARAAAAGSGTQTAGSVAGILLSSQPGQAAASSMEVEGPSPVAAVSPVAANDAPSQVCTDWAKLQLFGIWDW